MQFHLLQRAGRARIMAACAGSLLLASAPAWAQVGVTTPGATPSIAPGVGTTITPASPIEVTPPRVRSNVDQTVRGFRRQVNRATNEAAVAGATQPADTVGTFVADVSGHVKPEFAALAGDLRTAIDGTQGNVREKLILINDRISKISGDLVDRAKETKEQSRDRLGEVRNQLNEIHNELTTLAASAPDEARERVIGVRNRVDTLRDNLQTATDSRFRGTLESIQSRAAKVEQRARDATESAQARTRSAIGSLQENAANLQRRAEAVIEGVENQTGNRPGIDVNSDQRGKLGVTVRQGTTALTITSIAAGSTAAEIGLQAGDQILAVNRRRIVTHSQLVDELKAAVDSGGNATLMIRRNGRTQELQANLARATDAPRTVSPVR